MDNRESFQSRLGFILISAGCAIGIGNVWKFPYMVGQNGGGMFVLFYLLFLISVGVPIMTMEFAVGRASRKSSVQAFRILEPAGTRWHWSGYLGMAGNYILMFFYTTVSGWMLYYFYLFCTGRFSAGMDGAAVSSVFSDMLASPGTMLFWMLLVVVMGIAVCSLGLENGVERITKWMMLALLVLIVILAVHCLTLPGAGAGLKFYLVPSLARVREVGLFNVIVAAMNQSFFTLSIGIGSMAIFGSYIDKQRSLAGEATMVIILDTFVALTAGLIIFPACFAYGVDVGAGPGLIFVSLPNMFNNMAMGRLWGTCFFVFMSFAALSTVVAVFEHIIANSMDILGWTRKKASLVNMFAIFFLSLPCVFGFNIWSSFAPLGKGTIVLDLEDFIVSNTLLPLGSLAYVLFCTRRYGWGWDNFLAEANTGIGLKFSKGLRWYMTYVPVIIVLVVFVYGYYEKFFM